jgi:hypothetical protein
MNNYCLLYNKSHGTVEHVLPERSSSGRCDFAILAKCKPKTSFFSIDRIMTDSMTHPSQSLQAMQSLRKLIARILCFCYSDFVLVWEQAADAGPADGRRHAFTVELLAHNSIFNVYDDGRMTFRGMTILHELPTTHAHWTFWSYQVPTVCIASNALEPTKPLPEFLVVFDVHRKDRRVLNGISTKLSGLFGNNSNAREKVLRGCGVDMNDDAEGPQLNFDRLKHLDWDKCGGHVLHVHPSGLFLMPRTLSALHSYIAVANRFGRTDIVDEVKPLSDYLGALHTAYYDKWFDPTNFARDNRADGSSHEMPKCMDANKQDTKKHCTKNRYSVGSEILWVAKNFNMYTAFGFNHMTKHFRPLRVAVTLKSDTINYMVCC